jgi:hypothetical protein
MEIRVKRGSLIPVLASAVWLAATAGASAVKAQTYISAEAIPAIDIVGTANLAKIEALDYATRELWTQRLLDCHIVQNVIDVLAVNGAIRTVVPFLNTSYRVAAGGFEGVTDPSYVFTMVDSGPVAVNPEDVFVLDNALGYALNQDGTAQFSLRYNPNDPNSFSIAYGVVTFGGALTGEQAQRFFNYLGTIDAALWTGTDAGFTQVNLQYFGLNDSMLFLIGDVSTTEFENGLSEAARTTPDAAYSPLGKNGKPTTATGGAAFPGNDWATTPNGEGYLSNLVNPSPQLLSELARLRQQHLEAVASLLSAINSGNVSFYLNYQFKCPQ